LFYWLFGDLSSVGSQSRCTAAIRFNALSRSFLCKSPCSRAFARIGVQTGGGNVHKRVPPPVLLMILQILSLPAVILAANGMLEWKY
jgi:hypothetical protein